MTSFMYKIRDFSTPRLFILQFIFNKTKVFTLLWDESYHNISIYHINKKKYNSTVQLTQKSVSNFHLCQLFTINVYMPTVQFAKVPNKSSISNNCCVCYTGHTILKHLVSFICNQIFRSCVWLCTHFHAIETFCQRLKNSKSVWSGNTTIINRRQPRGTVRKSRSTITRHQEDKLSKATSSFFPIKMIAIIEWT